jgi:HSP20 family protein
MNQHQSEIPVKVYRREQRLTVAAPMPGMEPQDITVTLSKEGKLMLAGELRGAFKDIGSVIKDEWNPGPYHRDVDLDASVDGSAANATYQNGVLVVSLPESDSMIPATIQLEKVGPAEGRSVGSTGNPPR